jgi:hypothetical protein
MMGRRRPAARRAPDGQLKFPLFTLTTTTPVVEARPFVPPAPRPAPAPRLHLALEAAPITTGTWTTAAAENRARDLAARRLADGRPWLALLGKACLTNLVSITAVLAGDRSPAARAAREAALAELLQLGAGEEHEVAAALGIADHRTRPERDRTGTGGAR